MRYIPWLIAAMFALPVVRAEQLGVYQHGKVVRMVMSNCAFAHHGFIAAMGGSDQAAADGCPEYTLVSEKVVYVIVGKSSNQLIPLADVIDFRVHNNELVVRVDDAKHEAKFRIKEMVLRSEWDMIQKHIEQQLSAPSAPAEETPPMPPPH